VFWVDCIKRPKGHKGHNGQFFNVDIAGLTACMFINIQISHYLYFFLFLILVSFTFSTLGVIMGVCAYRFEDLQHIPIFVITPLTFLGGIFYNAEMLTSKLQFLLTFNPMYYMINGLRFSFYLGSWVGVLGRGWVGVGHGYGWVGVG